MSRIFLQSYAAGKWLPPSGTVSELKSAVTGKVVRGYGEPRPRGGRPCAAPDDIP